MSNLIKRFIPLLLVVVPFVIASCTSKSQIRPGDSLEVAYEKALRLYERERYTDATRAFETVLSIGRGTEIAEESQFLLAESYFKNRDYLVAASEYRRFYTNYPRSEKRIDAEYNEAMCYHELSPRYKLDQTDTFRAIELMQLFIGRYPGTDRATDAANMIDSMRDKLAQKEYSAAELYMRIRSFEAAAVYYNLTIDAYPETTWAEKALAKQIFAYINFAEFSVPSRQAERYQLALDSYQKYVQLFPNGENRSLVEEYRDIATDGLRNSTPEITSN
ncbi:MAG TPA: outer membrane protein assembly factor BamD [Bacteroidetes bacterium]|nr:outer membrane protein assembly factor BamD [Bacteroidota bacterium]